MQSSEATLQIDAQLLANSTDLLLLAQCMVEGYGHGMHRSPFAGSSQEFASYRAFLPGDSPYRIDWKVYGRTDELVIREYEQESNMLGYFFLDATRSMDFGEGAGHKFTYGKLLCATLAVLMNGQQDAPGLIMFGRGETVPPEDWWPPSARRDHLENMVAHLSSSVADGANDHPGGIDEMIGECRGRSLSVFVTDGLMDPSELKDVLGGISMRGGKVILFHLLAREEIDPEFGREVILVDQETGAERVVDGASYAAVHREHLKGICEEIERICHDTETEYCLLPTDQPLNEALRRFISLRNG